MKNYSAKINITLRKGILDVQGKAVEQALHSIGFESMSNVRIGKFVELNIAADNQEHCLAQVDDACRQLIANPIIEDFIIKIDEIN